MFVNNLERVLPAKTPLQRLETSKYYDMTYQRIYDLSGLTLLDISCRLNTLTVFTYSIRKITGISYKSKKTQNKELLCLVFFLRKHFLTEREELVLHTQRSVFSRLYVPIFSRFIKYSRSISKSRSIASL